MLTPYKLLILLWSDLILLMAEFHFCDHQNHWCKSILFTNTQSLILFLFILCCCLVGKYNLEENLNLRSAQSRIVYSHAAGEVCDQISCMRQLLLVQLYSVVLYTNYYCFFWPFMMSIHFVQIFLPLLIVLSSFLLRTLG